MPKLISRVTDPTSFLFADDQRPDAISVRQPTHTNPSSRSTRTPRHEFQAKLLCRLVPRRVCVASRAMLMTGFNLDEASVGPARLRVGRCHPCLPISVLKAGTRHSSSANGTMVCMLKRSFKNARFREEWQTMPISPCRFERGPYCLPNERLASPANCSRTGRPLH